MEANELRIGNWVTLNGFEFEDDDNKYFQVWAIDHALPHLNTIDFGVGVVDWENIKPIPLTEEWLLKFGFKKHHDGFYNKILAIEEIGYLWFYSIYPLEDSIIKLPHLSAQRTGHYLKCVHQLQNLYHALTGKELTIKE